MAINASSGSPEHYGILTNWAREIPIASTLAWVVHGFRNGIAHLIGSQAVSKALGAVV